MTVTHPKNPRSRSRCIVCGAKVRHRTYCLRHTPIHDANWRSACARQAALAGSRVRHEQAKASTHGLKPWEAYERGYQRGYKRAYRAWKAWATKVADAAATERMSA